ncbi:hypothetical protein, conserved [Eimeria tenella]|uniref:Uncharacterized protein n=1 Tax=Eimeria tenella TaxID=5802 RepID=U6KXL8_EIMTE|nr:hypothetical protein, conserved [Eimeria tenella]CDJ41683.1 hypothetical protein, conserved [Eimeria tenella]|eukprot:XP_013232433.1 hypothetical protein, conserved [Eimeria tenella]
MNENSPRRSSGVPGAPRNSGCSTGALPRSASVCNSSGSSGRKDGNSNSCRNKEHGKKGRNCCPSASNWWLLQPLLLRAQQVFAAVEFELQQTLKQQQQHIAAASVRDLQAFADLLSSLVCNQDGQVELPRKEALEGPLVEQHCRGEKMQAFSSVVGCYPESTSVATREEATILTTTGAAATPAFALLPSSERATLNTLARRLHGSKSQQQLQQEPLDEHENSPRKYPVEHRRKMEFFGNLQGEKRRKTPGEMTRTSADQATAVAPAGAATATGTHQSRRKRGSLRDEGDTVATAVPGAADNEALVPVSTVVTSGIAEPTPSVPPPPPPPPQGPAVITAVPPTPSSTALFPPPPPPPPLPPSSRETILTTGGATAKDSRLLNDSSVAVPGLSSEALEALTGLDEKGREETIAILNALSLPSLVPLIEQHRVDPLEELAATGPPVAPGASGDSDSEFLGDSLRRCDRQQMQEEQQLKQQNRQQHHSTQCSRSVTGQEASLSSAAPGVAHCRLQGTSSLSILRPAEFPRASEGSDAEEGEISDCGCEAPPAFGTSVALGSSPQGQAEGLDKAQQNQQQLGRSSAPTSEQVSCNRSDSNYRDADDTEEVQDVILGASVSCRPTVAQCAGRADPSLLDALIAARPLSSEAVLSNLYSLKKCEAARPQPQPQRKQKRRTQEAQQRHRQRWAEIQHRRAQAVAKRQQMKASALGSEENVEHQYSKSPPQPLTPFTPY